MHVEQTSGEVRPMKHVSVDEFHSGLICQSVLFRKSLSARETICRENIDVTGQCRRQSI